MINQFTPTFAPNLGAEIQDYLSGNPFITEFKKTKLFEQEIAKFIGVKHAVACNNGTIALTLSALSLGISPGDEIIVPNFTMIASANAFSMIGAKIKLVDVERDSLCLDKEKAEKAITQNTKAVVLVSAGGRSPSYCIHTWKKELNERGIFLIEDAAQSLGSFYNNSSLCIGNLSDIATLSFSPPKIISTGQGGMVLTNNDETANALRRLKDFGRSGGGNDVHTSLGYNFKFTDLQAIVGLSQLKDLKNRIKIKKRIYAEYSKGLADIKEVRLVKSDTRFVTPWFYEIIVKQRDNLIEYLKNHHIGTRVMYPPLCTQTCQPGQVCGNWEISKEIGTNGLWLPSSHTLTSEDVDYVCSKIRSFYSKN